MIDIKYKIEIYSDIKGKEPFVQWLEGLEKKIIK